MLLMITMNARDVCIKKLGKDITQEICEEIYAGRGKASTIENAKGKAPVFIVEVGGHTVAALVADGKLITVYTSYTIYGLAQRKKRERPKTVYVGGKKKEVSAKNRWVDLSKR